MWSFLRPFLAPHRRLILLGLILNAFSGVAISAQVLIPKYLLDDILLAPRLTESARLSRLIFFAALYLLIVVFLRMAVWHLSFRIFTHVREQLILQLRSLFFRQINALCLRFHRRTSSGELYSYLFGSPLGQVQQYLQQLAMSGAGSIFLLLSTLAGVASWDLSVALIFLATMLGNFALMSHTQRRIKTLHRRFLQTEGDVGGYVADLLRGNRTIKLHAAEPHVLAQFNSRAGEMGQQTYRRDVQSHIENMKQETLNYGMFALLAVVVSLRYLHGHLTAGEVLVSLGALTTLSAPMSQLFLISTLQGAAQVSVKRLRELLAEQSSTPDPAQPLAPPRGGALALRGLTFAYATQPVFQDLDLLIPYGEKVALVGPSGSGKSTLTQLLLRLYDPGAGVITLAGHDLRQYRGRDLRRLFGVVPQDPYLFQTSVRDNLRLIRPEASDAALQQACERANAWEFIAQLPEGLDTVLGEGGATLSGGQRQRLAIARALLINPPFFIFDEATSALDGVSERLIQESLREVLVGRTAIFIAHRLSTVVTCDRLLVLEQGRIVQEGTYAELSRQKGLLRELVASSDLLH